MSLQESVSGSASTQNRGNKFPHRGKISPTIHAVVARAIWPTKTAFMLAQIGNVSDRAAKDWLSGKVAPPATVVTAMLVEITKRD